MHTIACLSVHSNRRSDAEANCQRSQNLSKCTDSAPVEHIQKLKVQATAYANGEHCAHTQLATISNSANDLCNLDLCRKS